MSPVMVQVSDKEPPRAYRHLFKALDQQCGSMDTVRQKLSTIPSKLLEIPLSGQATRTPRGETGQSNPFRTHGFTRQWICSNRHLGLRV